MGIVGRDAELSAAEWFLDTVRNGAAALVFRGEPGIGKTTVLEHTLHVARQRGFRVLACRPGESETNLSLSALADILADLGEDELASLAEPQRRGIEVALLRREPLGEDTEWRTTAAGVLSTLGGMARVGPVLVAVDDAHWLDPASARVLEYVTRRLGDRQIGLILSLRAEHADPLALARSFPSDRRREVDLGPLSLASLQHIIAAEQDQRLPRTVLIRLHELSGGNPFYALEIARAVATLEQPLRAGDALPLPANLSLVPAERLSDLSPEATDALLAAAVLTDPTVEAVGAVLGRRAESGLAEAESRGLIREDDDHIRFPHPLLRAMVYDRASAADRRRIHRRVAETTVEPEQRAGHLARATTPPDREVAAALDVAAGMASSRGAPDSAAQYAEQARRFTSAGDENDLRRRSLEAAQHHFDAGDAARAKALLQEVTVGFAPGVARAAVRWRLAKAMSYERSYGDAAAVLTDALAETDEDPILRFRIQQDLAFDLMITQGVPAGLPYAQAAMSSAEAVGDPLARDEALATLTFINFFAGNGFPEELRHHPWPAPNTGGFTQVSRTPMALAAGVLMWSDDLDGARVLYEQVYRHTHDRGLDNELNDLLWQMTELECFAGRWDAAEQHAAEARSIAVVSDYPDAQMSSLYAAARIDALRGRLDRSRQQANESLQLAQEAGSFMGMGMALSALSFVSLSEGRPEDSRRTVGPLMDLAVATGVGEPSIGRFFPDGIEALIALGELENAEAILAVFEQRATALGRVWALATSARCRALLLAARGDLEGATDVMGRCMQEHQRLPMPFERARSLLIDGQIHRRSKRKRAASDSLAAARVIFEDLGAPTWVSKAEAELGRVGLRPRAPGTLTASEERVARLAAAGLTTRQVAEAAFMTPKSVDGVLTRIYRKLGIHSRAELGARMAGPEGVDAVRLD